MTTQHVKQRAWPSRRDRALAFNLVGLALASVIVAGLIGQLIRDRSVATAILMYIPVLPVSMLGLALDLAFRGRALPPARFTLSTLAVIGAAATAAPMIGWGALNSARATEQDVSVLHWNVQSGGGLFYSPQSWLAQRHEIVRHKPDLIVLSEAPPAAWIDQLVADLGPGASRAGVEHLRGSCYWHGLAVCSRWPVRLEEVISFPNGEGMSVIVDVDRRPLRILVVDGKSNPFVSRLPFLGGIVATSRAARDAGRPFDVIVGDFNTPSRSLGFDPLVKQGYALASDSAAGWRATFPSWLPIYDIDHVWLAPELRVGRASFFNGPYSDHRGQIAHLLVPAEVIGSATTRDRAGLDRPDWAFAPRDEGLEAGRRRRESVALRRQDRSSQESRAAGQTRRLGR